MNSTGTFGNKSHGPLRVVPPAPFRKAAWNLSVAKEIEHHIQRRAETGDDNALLTLARWYRDGRQQIGLKPDLPKAIERFERLAELGNPHAQFELIELYSGEAPNGQKFINRVDAVYWCQRLVENELCIEGYSQAAPAFWVDAVEASRVNPNLRDLGLIMLGQRSAEATTAALVLAAFVLALSNSVTGIMPVRAAMEKRGLPSKPPAVS